MSLENPLVRTPVTPDPAGNLLLVVHALEQEALLQLVEVPCYSPLECELSEEIARVGIKEELHRSSPLWKWWSGS